MCGRTLAVAVLVASLVATAAAPDFENRIPKDKESLHALQRLTFGIRPGDVEAVRKLGVKHWIDTQLHPDRIEENPLLDARLERLTTLAMSPQEVISALPPQQVIRSIAKGALPLPEDPARRALLEKLVERYRARQRSTDGETPERKRRDRPGMLLRSSTSEQRRELLTENAPQQVVAQDLLEQKIYRAVYSNRQLVEVLTDFWFNHFNVFLDKGADRYLVTSYERDAIRPHVLGKFSDMLHATAQHPAMLFYLDNWQSVSPNAQRPRARRTRGLNENYARELLELHTLGVDGGYTQKDIVEVARCFTGWTILQPFRTPEFTFNPRVHDGNEKTVLGVKIPAGGGEQDGLKVLDVLAKHPSTARFISTKLAQRFVHDNPPAALVNAMAQTFLKTNGDLKKVMQTMLASREFWSDTAYRSKLKSPFEMAVSSLRVANAEATSTFALAGRIGDMGQPLYRKLEPTGYPITGKEWVNSAALLGRMNFALDLLQNKIQGVRVDSDALPHDALSFDRRLLGFEASPQTRSAIERAVSEGKSPETAAALVLGSPEFQRR
jgi:uncharacterized protein (DUF1800 family)